MYILVFVILVMLCQYLTNKILNISSDNRTSYEYSKRDTFILLGFLVVSIILQKVMPRNKIFWIGCGVYAAVLLITMIILGTIKRIIVLKQREEIKSIFEVLEPVIPNEFKIKNKDTGEFRVKDNRTVGKALAGHRAAVDGDLPAADHGAERHFAQVAAGVENKRLTHKRDSLHVDRNDTGTGKRLSGCQQRG